MYDFDGDGMISHKELDDMLKADLVEMNLDMTPEEREILIKATLKQYHEYGDGEGDSISFDQYNAYAQENREKFQAEMTVKIKKRLLA